MSHLPKLLLFFIAFAPLITPLNYQGAMLPDLFRGVYFQSGVLLITILWLFSLIKTPTISIHKIILPFIVFLIWASLSLLWAENQYFAITNLTIWLQSLLLFFVSLQLFKTQKEIINLLNFIVISGVIVSIIGISQHLFDFNWITQATKPAGTFGNKNMAVHFLVLIIPINIGLFLNSQTKKQQLVLSFALSIISLYLVYANSRAGYLSFLIQTILFAVFIFRHKKLLHKTHKILIVLALLLPLLINSFNKGGIDIQTRLDNITKTHENQLSNERIPMWLNTLSMIKENPILGVGLGNWRVQYPLYLDSIANDWAVSENKMHRHTHNDWLEITSSLGIIGLLLLLWLVFTLGRFIKNLLKTTEIPFVIFGLSMSFIGLLIDGAFSFPLKLVIAPMLIMVVFACLVVLEKNKQTFKIHFIFIISLIVLFIVLFSMSIKSNLDKLKAQVYYSNALIYQNNNAYQKMQKQALKAYQYNPDKMVHQLTLANAYLVNKNILEAQNLSILSLKSEPYNYALLTVLAKSYLTNNKTVEAQETLEKLAKIMKNHSLVRQFLPKIYQQKIAGLIKNKKYFDAKKTYLKLLKIEKTAINYQNLAIIMFNYLNEKKQSVVFFKQALKLNPKLAQATNIKNIIKRFQ